MSAPQPQRSLAELFAAWSELDPSELQRQIQSAAESPELVAECLALLALDSGRQNIPAGLRGAGTQLLGSLAVAQSPGNGSAHAAQSLPILLPGAEFAGCVLREPLAGGSSANVWLANSQADGSEVVIKFQRPGFSADLEQLARLRFAREAQLLASVELEGLPRLLATGEYAPGKAYLVLERITGQALDRQAAARFGVLELCLRAAQALERLHAAGMLHGDLKPEHLRVDSAGRIWLLDLGNALHVATPTDGRLALEFTPGYQAPELKLGSGLSTASDVFALAQVLRGFCQWRELLTEAGEWGARRLMEVLNAASLADPSARLADGRALRAAMERVVSGVVARQARRRLGLAALAAAGVAGLCLLGLATWRKLGNQRVQGALAAAQQLLHGGPADLENNAVGILALGTPQALDMLVDLAEVARQRGDWARAQALLRAGELHWRDKHGWPSLRDPKGGLGGGERGEPVAAQRAAGVEGSPSAAERLAWLAWALGDPERGYGLLLGLPEHSRSALSGRVNPNLGPSTASQGPGADSAQARPAWCLAAGWLALDSGRPGDALVHFERAMGQPPGDPQVWPSASLGLALALGAVGQWESARAAFAGRAAGGSAPQDLEAALFEVRHGASRGLPLRAEIVRGPVGSNGGGPASAAWALRLEVGDQAPRLFIAKAPLALGAAEQRLWSELTAWVWPEAAQQARTSPWEQRWGAQAALRLAQNSSLEWQGRRFHRSQARSSITELDAHLGASGPYSLQLRLELLQGAMADQADDARSLAADLELALASCGDLPPDLAARCALGMAEAHLLHSEPEPARRLLHRLLADQGAPTSAPWSAKLELLCLLTASAAPLERPNEADSYEKSRGAGSSLPAHPALPTPSQAWPPALSQRLQAAPRCLDPLNRWLRCCLASNGPLPERSRTALGALEVLAHPEYPPVLLAVQAAAALPIDCSACPEEARDVLTAALLETQVSLANEGPGEPGFVVWLLQELLARGEVELALALEPDLEGFGSDLDGVFRVLAALRQVGFEPFDPALPPGSSQDLARWRDPGLQLRLLLALEQELGGSALEGPSRLLLNSLCACIAAQAGEAATRPFWELVTKLGG